MMRGSSTGLDEKFFEIVGFSLRRELRLQPYSAM
jgi:hypothetical protein